LGWGKLISSDILKVAHHGSETSTTADFLKLVSPGIALISVGRDNKFNHPSPFTLQKLSRINSKPFRTDMQGAIWLEYNAGDWRLVSW
jgi:competence protein ComEC